MKDQNNTRNMLSKAFLSFFFIGYAPKAPGTFGSAATIPLILLLGYAGIQLWQLIVLILLLILFSSIVTEKIQQEIGLHDPQWIVIDEVIGMLTTWAFVFPSKDWLSILLVFALFRVFDIVKIWPASYFDKKIKHGFGTIFDDVISGIMAGIVLLVAKIFL